MQEFVDWPKGLPESERKVLVELVAEALCKRGPLGTHALAEAVHKRVPGTRLPVFDKAAVWDWIHKAVARAAREVAAEKWCLHDEAARKADDAAEESAERVRRFVTDLAAIIGFDRTQRDTLLASVIEGKGDLSTDALTLIEESRRQARDVERLTEEKATLEALLQVARAQIRDMTHSYPEKDLCAPPRATVDAITKALGDAYDYEKGE